MKNEILDTPFHDSFSDFLEKGETILWTKTFEEEIEIPLILNDEGQISFHLKKIRWFIIFIIFLSIICLFVPNESGGLNWAFAGIIYVFGLVNLPRYCKIYGKKIHQTSYAITHKQILFRLAHLPKNEIHSIHFSQIKSFITLGNKLNKMTFILSIKNPESIPFVTYAIDLGEQRHQPTLENIEDHQAVAKLIREGIKNENT